MDYPLQRLMPPRGATTDEVFSRFLEYVDERRLHLYESQENAILALFEEKNVILNTPTGSGKSLVATALHFKSLAQGRRSVYTCPIKALVNEKFLALCRDFGPDNVGMSTGDASVNRDAPILCCTAEILANIALRDGGRANVDDVIMDEFHYYSDRERGVAWQVPMLTLPQARFLLMSATLGDTTFFAEDLTDLNKLPTEVVYSQTRPVPLEFKYSETALDKTVEELVQEGKAPVYIVHFSQMEAAESAQNFMSLNFCSRDEKEALSRAVEKVKFSSPYGPEIRKWLKHGIGLHHAGLLPKYRVLIEQLAQSGLLKIICGTDTLGVGINVPLRTVLLTKLSKYDGQKTGILTARDFHQITGRAGRKGFDDKGWVVVQAPEHVIENLKQENKAAGDPKKLKKIVKKSPEKGFVSWDRNTFTRLVSATPERLVSRFQVSHGMLLNVLSRRGDGCRAMRNIIKYSHESPSAKRTHYGRAWQLFRSLLDRKIIEFVPPDEDNTYLRVNVALQDDFALDQTLSLYLIDTIQLVDPESPTYALDLLTLVESIVEDPDIILRKQLDRLKSERMAEMKQEGLDYMQRMDELEKLEYPKPNREFVYSTFNQFSAAHPWVGEENIRPKSIAREMFENFRSFADYIKDYDLQRVEGILLRHLSGVYKVLSQTVPDTAKTEPVREMELYLSTLVRSIDSSLLDEWERLRDPNYRPAERSAEATDVAPQRTEAPDITRDETTFVRLIRNRVFAFLSSFRVGNQPAALEFLNSPEDRDAVPWTEDRLDAALDAYLVEHSQLCLDPNARNQRHTYLVKPENRNTWIVQQMLVDPDAHNDWVAEFEIDLARSRETSEPVTRLLRLGPLTAHSSESD